MLVKMAADVKNVHSAVCVTAASKAEYKLWVNGLEILVKDTLKSSYPLQVERYLPFAGWAVIVLNLY